MGCFDLVTFYLERVEPQEQMQDLRHSWTKCSQCQLRLDACKVFGKRPLCLRFCALPMDLSCSEQENLRAFDNFLKDFYRSNKTTSRYSSMLSSRMFLNKKGVKLKGKAAQVKALGLPLLLFWEQFSNPEIEIHQQILVYLKLNVKCEKILECHKGDMFLGHLAFW